MLKITVDEASIRQMKINLGAFGDHLPRHLATAVNRTAKTVRVQAAKALNPLVNLKLSSENKGVAKPINKAATLKKTIKQKNKAEPGNAGVTIGLWEGHYFPVRMNEAKSYSKKRRGKRQSLGVQYKTHMGGGWTVISDGFSQSRWRGDVYRPASEGARKLVRVLGKRPGDYFREGNIGTIAADTARERLPIEINRRLREIILAASGQIKLRASRELGK
jgi:hypothetical protein